MLRQEAASLLWSERATPTAWGFGCFCCNRLGAGVSGFGTWHGRRRPSSLPLFSLILVIVGMLSNTLDAHQHLSLEETIQTKHSGFIIWCMCIAVVWWGVIGVHVYLVNHYLNITFFVTIKKESSVTTYFHTSQCNFCKHWRCNECCRHFHLIVPSGHLTQMWLTIVLKSLNVLFELSRAVSSFFSVQGKAKAKSSLF